MRRARRLCALAVVMALCAGVAARTPAGCVVCPPGCPMHARREAGAEPPRREVGCHRAARPSSADVCLRASCGRDAEAGQPLVLLSILGGVTAAVKVAPPVPLRPTAVGVASALAPEPPTEPPRAVPA